MCSRHLFNFRTFAAMVIVVSSSLVALSGVASAASGDLTYSLSTTPYVATVTGQSGYTTTVTIPPTITVGVHTYSVTSIGVSAFESDGLLTSITIPNSVTSISDYAFNNDTSLTSVSFTSTSSVTSISDYAFNGDASLTSIIIPNSVTSIGDHAFSESALTSIIIPNSVTSIGDGAFFYDTALTSIIIPNSVTTIGISAFDTDILLASVTIGNSVTSIGDYAFENDTVLTSIIIPNSVTSIGVAAFYGDTDLTLSNPTDYVATWTGTGGPYTTADLKNATANRSVTGTWASVVRVAPIVYSKPTAPSNVTASMNSGTATVSFTPGSSGNLATYDEIDMYINGQLVGNVCNVTGATSCPISNLGPDAVFSFTVTAINSKGSAVSTVSNTVSYSSPAVVTTTSTSPPTTTTTVPPVKRTITCVKGKISKKVTAVSPVCPAGYKKK